MVDRPQAYEQELAETVGTSTDRWLTELRLALVGIAVSVGLGAADIALGLGGWEIALAVGLVSTFVFVGLLWRLRPRAETRREPTPAELSRVEDELARIRAALRQERDPLRELLDSLAAEADALAAYMERVWEESYIGTASTDTTRRLRAYDAQLHELRAELRCRRAKT